MRTVIRLLRLTKITLVDIRYAKQSSNFREVSMIIISNIIFSLALALLFTHEMDAVRRQEWKMFVILKDMPDEVAYRIFTLLHIPLYALIFLLWLFNYLLVLFYILDIFLILHLFLHIGFSKHPDNNLKNRISKTIIFSAGLLALTHLIIISI